MSRYRRRCAKCGVTEDFHFTSDCSGFEPKAHIKGRARAPEDDLLKDTVHKQQQIKASDELLRLLILHHGDKDQ